MTNIQNTTTRTPIPALSFHGDKNQHDSLPAGGFHGNPQQHESLPAGGFHGDGQRKPLP